ncbi:MAG: L-threonylcarbamoyladenylate synthase [Oscillospiraceae bacterium]|nr:L-threonylcarbamoyladenylate synthase [Oscillospiraceae bacterium]
MTSLVQTIELLKAGNVVALPTETVYGLAGNALNSAAIAKIFATKRRPQDNPLIVHVSGIDMVRNLKLHIPPLAERLAERFWAGALTMVLRREADCPLPHEVSCGLDTAAVRVPDNAIFLEVIKKTMFPLAAPSANLSGSPSPTTAQHVRDDFGEEFPVVDGGACRVGIESTVVMFDDNDAIRILRPGAVTSEMLREYGNVVTDEGGSRHSPGTRYKHYAPRAKVIAVQADAEAFTERTKHERFVIANPETSTLFMFLRQYDQLNADKIFVRLPERSGVGAALYNRIIRAAEFEVTQW